MSDKVTYQQKLDELRQAFDDADNDGTGKLTEGPFKQFVQLGFKKPCPDGMYGYLCDHFAVQKSDGLTWENALQIWKQSNPAPKDASDLKAKTPGPKSKNTLSNGSGSGKAKSPDPASPSGGGQPSIGSMGRSQTERSTRGRVRNLGDDENLTGDNGAPRTRSPSPAGDRATINHRRETSLSGSMRNRGTRSYRDLSGTNANGTSNGSTSSTNNNNSTSPNVQSDAAGAGHNRVLSGSLDSDLSDTSVDTFSRSRSVRTSHQKRESSFRRMQSSVLRPSLDQRTSNTAHPLGGGADDAQSMVVQMIEQKYKNATAQLKEEKKKRKKADETTQQLLLQNEKLKQKLSEVETKCKKLEKDFKKASDEGRKFKGIVDDDRNAMTHVNTQLKSAKEERDEAFKLLRKMEDQHAKHLAKLKQKHAEELEKQTNGFLQTLGVDPNSGKGVREVLQELKETNISLNEQVDMLSEILARKEASLIHALSVLDELSSSKSRRSSNAINDDYKDELAASNKKTSIAQNFKNNVIQGLAKNKQLQGATMNGSTMNSTENGNNKARSPLPAPPVNRRKFSNPKPMHNADFYRHASSPRYYGQPPQSGQFHKNSRLNNKAKTDSNQLQGSTKTKEKSMEMLNNSLVTDVVNKQDAIDELQSANNTLVDQVMKLQRQLDDMHRTSQIFMQDNDMQPNGITTIKEETNNNGNNNNTNNTNNSINNTTNNNNANESNRSRASTQSEDLP